MVNTIDSSGWFHKDINQKIYSWNAELPAHSTSGLKSASQFL